MKRRKKIKLQYKKERVVFSDILPYELPIIFSNRYFYRFLVKNKIAICNINSYDDCYVSWSVYSGPISTTNSGSNGASIPDETEPLFLN